MASATFLYPRSFPVHLPVYANLPWQELLFPCRIRLCLFLPDGTEEDSDKACRDYNEIIHSVGGVDLQLLGLGHNGHIGFNEPGIAFETETHCVTLSDRTIKANMRFFLSEHDVPRQAYTMGIKTIMSAHKILVVVSGEDKAAIVKEAFFGPVTPQVPASILQLHNDVTLVADEAALSCCEGLF